MIRVITIDEFDSKLLEKFGKILYTAFAVGTEHSGSVRMPEGITEPIDAARFLETAQGVRAYADDKLLYFTNRKLKERDLISGTAPTIGFCKYNKDRAIISMHGIKSFEDNMKQVAKNALHQLGHLWELHHCLDPRCSMYPPWTPSFATGEPIFCTFCREKSEQKIRLAKS